MRVRRDEALAEALVANDLEYERTGDYRAWEGRFRAIVTQAQEREQAMLQEALGALRGLCDEAKQVYLIRAQGEPDDTYYLVENGKARKVLAEPGRRRHQVKSLASLAALAREHARRESPVTAWYTRAGVQVVLDDVTRRDTVTLAVRPSPQMELLEAWAKNRTPLSQQALVRTLRTVFPRALGGTGVLDVFRRMKFQTRGESDGRIEHGGASLGKRIEARLDDADKVPEELDFHVPAFDGGALGVWCLVRCAVEVDAKAETVAIMPEAGGVEQAWLAAEDSLAVKLSDALGEALRLPEGDERDLGDPAVAVYYGVP